MTTEELNTLKDRVYKTAVEHGFHEEEKPDAYWLGLVMSEAGEAINADRKGIHANVVRFEEVMAMRCISPRVAFESNIKDSVEDEIADIVIRLLDFAGLKGYTIEDFGISAIPSLVERQGLSGTLFQLVGSLLGHSLNHNSLEAAIDVLLDFLPDCFEKMTGSDKDLWWFVEKKMAYNELRPRLNGKKY